MMWWDWLEIAGGLASEIVGIGATFRGGYHELARRRNSKAQRDIPKLEIELGLREDPFVPKYLWISGSSPLKYRAPQRRRNNERHVPDPNMFPGNKSWRL